MRAGSFVESSRSRSATKHGIGDDKQPPALPQYLPPLFDQTPPVTAALPLVSAFAAGARFPPSGTSLSCAISCTWPSMTSRQCHFCKAFWVLDCQYLANRCIQTPCYRNILQHLLFRSGGMHCHACTESCASQAQKQTSIEAMSTKQAGRRGTVIAVPAVTSRLCLH